jgi:hypothetical protein
VESDARTLYEEENVVSLRSAFVLDDGDTVSFTLMPADMESVMPAGKKWYAPKDFEWALQDSTYLYRHMRSPREEEELIEGFSCFQQDVRPMAFDSPPEFALAWSDSGHSVALYLNGEAWAFIEERNHRGYSKGVLRADKTGGPWDQAMFERIFGPR